MLAKAVSRIMEYVQSRVIGQSEALEEIRSIMIMIAAGILDPRKPLCILNFAGPTGVGKSEVADALSFAIHGNSEMINRVNCDQLQESHSLASIVGAPPGYVGYCERSSVINKIKVEGKNGFPGILVFEEFEKSHPNVRQSLLGMFDKGRLKMNNGEKDICLTNTIIILTSNIGARQLRQEAMHQRIGFVSTSENSQVSDEISHQRAKEIVRKEMERIYSPELIGRIDRTIVFRWLNRNDIRRIVRKIASDFRNRLAESCRLVDYSESALDLVADNGYDRAYGARIANQAFRRMIELPIAEKIADHGEGVANFEVTAKNGQITVSMQIENELDELYISPKFIQQQAYHEVQLAVTQPQISSDRIEHEIRIGKRRLKISVRKKDQIVLHMWNCVFMHKAIIEKFAVTDSREFSEIFKLINNVVANSSVSYQSVSRLPEHVKVRIMIDAQSAVTSESFREKFISRVISDLRLYCQPRS